jgi:hypothetical protein
MSPTLLIDSECARTGIEQLIIDEDPNNTGTIFFRDMRTDVGTGPFTNVTAEFVVGTDAAADRLTGAATLIEHPAGSGRWRLP